MLLYFVQYIWELSGLSQGYTPFALRIYRNSPLFSKGTRSCPIIPAYPSIFFPPATVSSFLLMQDFLKHIVCSAYHRKIQPVLKALLLTIRDCFDLATMVGGVAVRNQLVVDLTPVHPQARNVHPAKRRGLVPVLQHLLAKYPTHFHERVPRFYASINSHRRYR